MQPIARLLILATALSLVSCATTRPASTPTSQHAIDSWLGLYVGQGDRFVQVPEYGTVEPREFRSKAERENELPAVLHLFRSRDDRALQIIAVVDPSALQRAQWLRDQHDLSLLRTNRGAISLQIAWSDLQVSDTLLRGHDSDGTSWILERRDGHIDGEVQRVDEPDQPDDVALRTSRSHLVLRDLTPSQRVK